ncbi:PadR family transcriptional regulator [Streptomyces deccanensis]|uniref:PadR family transcriptional regulator n=1 Tax=Streptomyces deccanensis TaxID=424188 RepID=UPI001EFAD27F|nr:PadR family transcriptional regulator [Streptomyces deccanensis]ULR53327.1 helix-turn-helix transcriptional regulator [Streptomyces deccanensis]
MPPVFAHGRLRLYLLKLLDEAPRHGYEVIRLLEERFQGLYAPSAGTVYPRLAKLEAEGLVTHTTEGGRKVYAITDAGRAELADRSGELADLELEIRESVAELAAEIRADVRGAAGDLRREMRAAASEARRGGGEGPPPGASGEYADNESWRAAKEEMRRVKQEWKEQARRAKDESRRAREEAQRARRQAKEAQEHARTQAQEELQRIAKRVQDHVQDHFTRGDWPTGVREGLTELAKEFGEFGKDFGKEFGKDFGFGRTATTPAGGGEPEYSTTPEDFPADYEPAWVHETPTGDPSRDLDRLLDRFRDDIRDAARDHGVTEDQLRDARRHLSTAAAHIGAILRAPRG